MYIQRLECRKAECTVHQSGPTPYEYFERLCSNRLGAPRVTQESAKNFFFTESIMTVLRNLFSIRFEISSVGMTFLN